MGLLARLRHHFFDAFIFRRSRRFSSVRRLLATKLHKPAAGRNRAMKRYFGSGNGGRGSCRLDADERRRGDFDNRAALSHVVSGKRAVESARVAQREESGARVGSRRTELLSQQLDRARRRRVTTKLFLHGEGSARQANSMCGPPSSATTAASSTDRSAIKVVGGPG